MAQLGAFVVVEIVPASHGAQPRSAVALGGDDTRSPFAHTECFVHDACPDSGWKVPSGHESHASAFVVVEIVPAPHATQPRSAVAMGTDAERSPFAHTECGRQNPLPVNGW